MVKKGLFTICTLIASYWAMAARVDTVTIHSVSMRKDIKCVVIKPTSYKKRSNHFPVVYLLHGYSGQYANWITQVPELQEYATAFNLIIVCPDGGYSSWYFDSPLDSTFRYETHIIKEVVPFIDSAYRTLPYPQYRTITGLSMGGHGALYLSFRHPAVFGAVGSMSGGVDLRESKNRFDISKRIGDTLHNANAWYRFSVIGMIDSINYREQPIFVDCGVEDIFINGNRQLHQKMLQLKIKHDYIERPGKHDWAYWKNAVWYHLSFFRRFFSQSVIATGG